MAAKLINGIVKYRYMDDNNMHLGFKMKYLEKKIAVEDGN